jgi:hypothetical protein
MPPSELIRDGLRALQAGNREEAIRRFMDAVRENRRDDEAWFHLGVALENPKRKREAFERVRRINPEHPRVQAEFDKLKPPEPAPKPKAAAPPADPQAAAAGAAPGTLLEDSGTFKIAGDGTPITPGSPGGTPTPPQSSEAASMTPARRALAVAGGVGKAVGSIFTRPFSLPVKVDGAPALVTLRGLGVRWLRMGGTSIRQLVTNRLIPEQETISDVTLWDALMGVMAAAFCFGVAEAVGRFVRGILEVGAGGVGGFVVTPIIAGFLGLVAVAAGVLLGGYSGQVLFERQSSQISITAHLGVYASAIMAAISLEAVLRIVIHVLIGITGNGALGILALMFSAGLTALVGYLLYLAWKKSYELDENTTTLGVAVTVGGGWLVMRLLLLLFGVIFRIPFF